MHHSSSDDNARQTSARRLAFTRAFDRHNVAFFKYFRRKTGNHHDAEDFSAIFWLNVYKTFATPQFDHVKLLQHKAEQVFLGELRKRKVRSFLALIQELPDVADDRPNRWQGTDEDERRIQAEFWERFPGIELTQKLKTVFWLKAWHGYTFEELAARFKAPVSTIQGWIAKVRKECAAIAEKESS